MAPLYTHPFLHLLSSNPDHPLASPPTSLKIQLTVVSSLSLSGKRVLALLVLGNLVGGVLLASLTLAVYNPIVRTMPPAPSIKQNPQVRRVLFAGRKW